ncbi:MAG: PucR family transcriptional regulator ligand-binding domain-containing protein [Anaerolineae bacterium]|nr:PucR family transcriptional regulator ligand-binding domain-containing protein [Anaerolineae bacterium]
MKVAEARQQTILGKATLVAGEKGLSREIRWVHIVDMPDIVQWVAPGQLLLTTGYAMPRDPQEQQALIRDLAKRDLAGVGMAVPRFFDHFPPACIAEANRWNLPLLEIPWEVPFASITEELHTAILAEQARILEQSERIHRTLTRAALEASSLHDIATTLGELIHRAVTFEDQDRRVLGYYTIAEMEDVVRRESLSQGYSPLNVEAHLSRLGYTQAIEAAAEPLRIPPFPELGFAGRIVCPIRLKGETVGKVWIIEGETPLSELDLRAAEHAAVVAALQIAHQRAIASLEARVGYSFLSALLEGRFEANPHSLERAQLQGFDPYGRYRLAIFVLDETLPLSREAVLRREQFADRLRYRLQCLNVPPLLSVSLNQIPALLPDQCDIDTVWESLACAEVALVISRSYSGIAGVRDAYQEAVAMLPYLQFGQYHRFEELLLPRIMMGDREAHQAFLSQLFDPLRQARRGDMLLNTVQAFARCDFSLKRTAQELHIHPKSLRYRLQRIAELMQIDWRSPEVRFRIQLAIRLLALQPESAD